jgi:hypothetical protein
VLLARQGQLSRASQDINWCLEKEPTGGATLYATACVAALAVEKSGDPQEAMEQALQFLERAFAQGYGQDRAVADPDLASIRQHPRFGQLAPSPTR